MLKESEILSPIEHSHGPELGGKYPTSGLDDEEYGLEILDVHEIIGFMDITAVPQTPQYVKGVINLHGRVIPVADLRLKFDVAGRRVAAMLDIKKAREERTSRHWNAAKREESGNMCY